MCVMKPSILKVYLADGGVMGREREGGGGADYTDGPTRLQTLMGDGGKFKLPMGFYKKREKKRRSCCQTIRAIDQRKIYNDYTQCMRPVVVYILIS